MKYEMQMPKMGESIVEATILRWLKKPGELVEKDEIILEISTDKVDSEIPSPADGMVSQVFYNEGDVVPVKEVIAVIDSNKEGSVVILESRDRLTTQPSDPKLPKESSNLLPPASGKTTGKNSGEQFFSPLVKQLASKHGISLLDLSAHPGSGAGGRFTKDDFVEYVASRESSSTSSPKETEGQASSEHYSEIIPPPHIRPENIAIPGESDWDHNGKKIVPMDRMRKTIAEHMVRSKHISPHVYSIHEVDMTEVSRWKQKHKKQFVQQEGFNLSFTPFFLEAAVKGLVEFPYINSSVEGNTVVLKKHVNIGCAVNLATTGALDISGLIVPVIKKAENLSLVEIARSLTDLAGRARENNLVPEDVCDGTFTVTNPGGFGTLIGTPIINQPQVAILCCGAIDKRPAVVDDQIEIREMCYLTLSYDHRIVDGALAGQFLAFIKNYFESWDSARDL